jgi:hypothetical protein
VQLSLLEELRVGAGVILVMIGVDEYPNGLIRDSLHLRQKGIVLLHRRLVSGGTMAQHLAVGLVPIRMNIWPPASTWPVCSLSSLIQERLVRRLRDWKGS